MKTRCRTHYRVVCKGKYKGLVPNNEMIVDSHDKDEVYYLFHVHLLDPNVKIYVCFNDGTQKRIKLRRAWRWM